MNTTFNYQSENDVVRILQVTDPHLFKDERSSLLGVNTLTSFKTVLSSIKQSDFNSDFILATGDLVQDGSVEAYQRFINEITCLNKPVFWLPGNHDYQPTMTEILKKSTLIQPEKHIIINQHWQIIMLDSQLIGVPHGELSQYQLEWLQEKLYQYPDRYTLVVLHHHLAPTNSAWLDQHNLRNTSEFLTILNQHQKIRAVVYGHIHQAMDMLWNGQRIISTPSTCIQFKPDSYNFSLDNIAPGWREFTLYPDGKVLTTVKRIPEGLFSPDLNISGY